MVLTILNLIIIGLIALLIGFVSVIAGLGGGVFVVPLLVVIFKVDLDIVVGTELVATVVYTIVGSIAAGRRKEIDYKFSFAFLIPASIATMFGALLTDYIPEFILISLLGIIALALSIKMLIETKKNFINNRNSENKDNVERDKPKRPFFAKFHYPFLKPFIKIERSNRNYVISIPVITIFGLLIGLITGLLGTSGGWLIAPLMILGFGYPPIIASGTSLFVILIKAVVGGATHLVNGNFDLFLFIALALSLPTGAFFGDMVKKRLRNRTISLILGICLFLVSAVIIIFYFLKP
ncbi:MAG: sulfite exporter TauE/SafE family protein [Candidatus Heimdallarchaeaceae archaeon]